MSAWLAFNSWGACVTEEDTDSKMVEELGKDESLRKLFEELLKANNEFSIKTKLLYKKLPVANVQKQRQFKRVFEKAKRFFREAEQKPNNKNWHIQLTKGEKNILIDWQVDILKTELFNSSTQEIFETQFNQIRNKEDFDLSKSSKDFQKKVFAPKCWVDYRGDFSKITRNWTNTLESLYQIRCNLFHGDKSLIERNDQELVYRAFQVMVYAFNYFFDKKGIIDRF